MEVDLTGKTVLVTGASRGIGRAVALRMAAAGARVAAHYYLHREGAESLQAEVAALDVDGPGSIIPFQADLARPDECDRLFDEVLGAFSRLDVLVNNAGVAVSMPLDGPTEAWLRHWDLTLHVNLRAPELLCRRALPHMSDHGSGRIINIASRAAFRGDTPEYMTYAASKAGLVALTRSIARGFGKAGIRAFVIAPGFVRTDMAQEFIDTYGEAHALDGIATDRLTEPDDVAPLVVFLASGLADHATGTTIDVNAASYVR